MQQLGIAGLDLCYSHLRTRQGNPVDDALDAAISLTDHVGPEVRLAAVQVLSASAKELSSRAAQQMTPKDQSRIDLVFQKLCSVVTMDTVPAVRLEALAGLSGELLESSFAVVAQHNMLRSNARSYPRKHQWLAPRMRSHGTAGYIE